MRQTAESAAKRRNGRVNRRTWALLCVPIALLSACVPADLASCEHADGLLYELGEGETCPAVCSDGNGSLFDWPADQDCPVCWVDSDGDGFGAEIAEGATAADCPGDELADGGGDCDDSDDNRFPGNREVCDGRDNDCDDATEFYSGEEVVEDDGEPRYACDLASSYMMYLRGGSTLAGQRVSSTSPIVRVAPGSALDGTLRLRFRNLQGSNAIVPAVAVASWQAGEPGQPSPFTAVLGWPADPQWPTNDDPPPGTSDNEYIVQETAPTTPGSYLLVVAASGQRRAWHVAAMSSYEYCVSDGDCPPVWDDDFALLTPAAKLNLVNLDDSMLAGCYSWGVARVPWLYEATRPDGGRCQNVDAEPDCSLLYALNYLACVYIEVEVEER